MYWLQEFNGVILPAAMQVVPVGSAPTRDGVLKTAEGFYDSYGSDPAPADLPQDISVPAQLSGTPTQILANIRALKGQRGYVGWLYRRLLDGTVERAWARLMQMPAEEEVQHINWQPLSFNWKLLSTWVGNRHIGGWLLDDGYYLDTGLLLDDGTNTALTNAVTTLTIHNGGSVACTNATVRIVAPLLSAMTAITVACTEGASTFTYNPGVAMGGTAGVVIDCGAKSVLNNGTGDYKHMSRSKYWLVLAPGDNTLTVTRTGGDGNCEIQIDFDEPME